MEGDGGRLEGEADEGEDDTGLRERVELPVDGLDPLGDEGEVEGSGGGVDEADAEQADRGGRDRGQEELQGRLGRLAVAVPQPDEGEGGQGGDLEGDDEGREVAGGGQQGGPGRGGEEEEPVLALGEPLVLVLQGGHRQQGGEEGAAEHQELDDEGEAVRGVAAHAVVADQAEGAAVGVEQGQQRQRGGGESGHRDQAEQGFALLAHEQVGDEDDESDDRRDGRRGDDRPVDGLDE